MKLEEIKHLKEKTFLKISTNQLIPKLINEIFYFIIGLSLFFLILYKFFPNFYREIIGYGISFFIMLIVYYFSNFIFDGIGMYILFRKKPDYINIIVFKENYILAYKTNDSFEISINDLKNYRIEHKFPTNLFNYLKVSFKFETNNNINFYLKNNDRNITNIEYLLEKYISMVEK
jgi:hypothetical protein